MVHLYKNGEKMKMSKRTGKAVTMRELSRRGRLGRNSLLLCNEKLRIHIWTLILDLAVSQSNENPVYYAQYAHARICSIFRQGEEIGLAT